MAMACQQCDPQRSAWRRREGTLGHRCAAGCFRSNQALGMAKGEDLPVPERWPTGHATKRREGTEG